MALRCSMSLWLVTLLLLVAKCLTAWTPQQQSPVIDRADPLAVHACHDLSARFPQLLSYPSNDVYEHEQAQYWSARQADFMPTCRLTPRNTQDTSDIMQYLHRHETDFAIVSGGHGTADGASNVDAGITLDLSSLSGVSISSDKSLVDVQTGARWNDVYDFLDKHQVTVTGARAGTVGVGGYLLGGGFSTLAARHGWSVDTVTGIEVVLANGTVLDASENLNPDLFRTLKGGGSNFGIPTRFTMCTFGFDQFQFAVIRYESASIERLIGQLSIAVQDAEADLDSSFELSVVLDPASGDLLAFLMFSRFGDLEESPLLQNLLSIPHGLITTTIGTPGHLASALDESNPPGYRQHKCTMTIRNDAATAIAITRAFASAIKKPKLAVDSAFRSGMLLQPIYQAQLSNKSDDVLGFGPEDSPLLLLSFEARWSLASLDDMYISLVDDLLVRCKNVANDRQTLHPFIYLNYAAAYQDPFAQLRQRGELEQLKAVRDRYDDGNFLEKHLKQPFKMWDGA